MRRRQRGGVEFCCFRETPCLVELPSQVRGELPAIQRLCVTADHRTARGSCRRRMWSPRVGVSLTLD